VDIDVIVQARAGPDFALLPTQKAISVDHGQFGRVDLGIVRYAGFAKLITLSVPGASPNMIATFAPATVGAANNASVLQLYVSDNVPAGTYALVIEGSSPGGPIRRVAVSLVVVAGTYTPPPHPRSTRRAGHDP
jgi:hypothetical protein